MSVFLFAGRDSSSVLKIGILNLEAAGNLKYCSIALGPSQLLIIEPPSETVAT